MIELFSKIGSAFSWMLIHSLWEGTIMILVLFLINFAFPATVHTLHARSRFSLLLFTLACLLTFFSILLGFNFNNIIFLFTFPLNINLNSFLSFYWLNAIWSIGFIYYLTKFILGQREIKNVINGANYIVPESWANQFRELVDLLGCTASVKLAQSDTVKSAFMSGFFNPIIIIPSSLINRLSPEETKFILLHELSHIINKDHWFNLLLCLNEMFFFFNPASRYLVAKIKLQRELCADTTSILFGSNSIRYASLLVHLEEMELNSVALAFFGDKNQLTQRVHNILNIKNSKISSPYKLIAFCVFGLAVFCNIAVTKSSINVQNIGFASPCIIASEERLPDMYIPHEVTSVHTKKTKTAVHRPALKNSSISQANSISIHIDRNTQEFPSLEIIRPSVIEIEEGTVSYIVCSNNTDVLFSLVRQQLESNESKIIVLPLNSSEKETPITLDPGIIIQYENELNKN